MRDGARLYVDLGGERNPPDKNSLFLDMVRDMQRKLVQLRTRNARLFQASEEKERLIKELTSWSSHETEYHGRERKEVETNSEGSEGGEASGHDSRKKNELQGEL